MAVHPVWLSAEAQRKVKAIRQFIPLSRLIQQRLSEIAKAPETHFPPAPLLDLIDLIDKKQIKVKKEELKQVAIYLNKDAGAILRKLKKTCPYGFNFRRFVLREIDRYYNKLRDEGKILKEEI